MKPKVLLLTLALALAALLVISKQCGRQEVSLATLTNQLQEATAQASATLPAPTNTPTDTPTNTPAHTPAVQLLRFTAQPGGKLRFDGTSTIHDWNVEGRVLGGFFEVEAPFPPTNPQPAPLQARAEIMIPVTSLKSSSGAAMDSIMYQAMQQTNFPRIHYRLTSLTLKTPPASYEATGDLTVSGVTNRLTMPVTIESPATNRLRITGSTALKMTSFGIQPPAPNLGGLTPIKTGDDVTLTFEWLAAHKPDTKSP